MKENESLKPAFSLKNTLLYMLIAAAVVIIDQITKKLAVLYLMPIGDYPLWKGVLHLTYVENTGAAFGMMRDKRWIFMLLSSVAIVAVAAVMIAFSRHITPLLGVSLAFIIGGGIGNMIDRLLFGYVVDFINFELINFAVFNGADSFICVGAGLMLIYMIVIEFKRPKPENAAKSNE